MPETTFCPYCNAKLRIASASKRPQRVKCSVCKNHFHPGQVISGGSSSRWLNQPLHAAAAEAESSPGERQPTAHVAASTPQPAPTDQSIDPEVIKAAYPDEMLERRDARQRHERERSKDGVKHRRRHRTSGFQMTLVIVLVGMGLAGLAGAAWYFLRPSQKSIEGVESPPVMADDLPRVSPPSLLEKDFAPKPLPTRLLGVWELRSDDERRGWLEFRSDSTFSAKAWRGETVQTPSKAKWYLVQEEGDDLVFEVGQLRGGMGNIRYFITLTGPDAFTVTAVAQGGPKRPDDSRFVRWTNPQANSQ